MEFPWLDMFKIRVMLHVQFITRKAGSLQCLGLAGEESQTR